MRSLTAAWESRLLLWLRVREFAVPPSMIESATARRLTGDWGGACATARVDVDVNLRAVARAQGRVLAARVRADLRHLAPDLLRWHWPRIAPDGLLRPGLTVCLARYDPTEIDGEEPVYLVARTPPAWADAGQRISLVLWGGSAYGEGAGAHPHPRPDRRFRLDLHRHLWDARRAADLRERSGVEHCPSCDEATVDPDAARLVPRGAGLAVDRWAAEAAMLLRAEGRAGSAVTVRLGTRRRLVLELDGLRDGSGSSALRMSAAPAGAAIDDLPILPDAATWVPPDLELLRAGLIDPGRLHPLVASALVPGHLPREVARGPQPRAGSRVVQCRGAWHRIGLVGGVLVPLDHDAAEIRREELLTAFGGPPLPCLRAIDEAHRHPERLDDVRALLDHGDAAGALAVVEELLGPDALLRSGALRDELQTAARRQVAHGLFRAGLTGLGPVPPSRDPSRRRDMRTHPRHATAR